jgi:membrane protease YdiL (CAAX protease family)
LPTNWPHEAWNPLFTGAAFVGAIVVVFASALAYLFVAVAVHAIDPRSVAGVPAAQQLLLQFVVFGALAVYLLIVIPLVARTPLRALGLRTPTARELGIGAAGALAMFVLVDGSGSLIASLLHRHDTEQAIALLKDMKTPGQRAFFFLLACAFAPFYEELAFRAFIFNALTRYTSIGVAALVSGIVFGLLHASTVPEIFTVGVPLAFGGIVLAYVYAFTKCFWANVFTHALFNTLSTVSIFLFHVS